jgi:hypothetical protein
VNVYPYKTIRSGRFTKYIVNIAENGHVVVEHYFKNKCKSQLEFESQNDIQSSYLPKNIKEIARWASFESKTIVNYHNINVNSPEMKWF